MEKQPDRIKLAFPPNKMGLGLFFDRMKQAFSIRRTSTALTWMLQLTDRRQILRRHVHNVKDVNPATSATSEHVSRNSQWNNLHETSSPLQRLRVPSNGSHREPHLIRCFPVTPSDTNCARRCFITENVNRMTKIATLCVTVIYGWDKIFIYSGFAGDTWKTLKDHWSPC